MCGAEANPLPGEPRPCVRDFAGMLALPGGRLLVFGGLDVAAKRLDDLWIFDCSTYEAFPPPLRCVLSCIIMSPSHCL